MHGHSRCMRYRLPLLLLTLLTACGEPRTAPAPPAAPNPFVAHALPAAARRWREGIVIERIPAGPYVYLRLRQSGGESHWLVSLRATTPRGDHVRALIVGQAEHFHSQRLDRDFSPLAFAAVRSVP